MTEIRDTHAPTVRTESTGRILVVEINRPERRNAVDGPTARALYDAFLLFEESADHDVAVLCGAGGTFCAGADLHAFADPAGASNPLLDDMAAPGPMGPSRLQLSKPVIAAIDGHAVAGGLELALWCDLRVMEEDAILGVFCRRWGVPLIDGGTVRLPRLIGTGRALDLILTGRPVAAAEAKAIGLVTEVTAQGQARRAALALAQRLAALPQTCLKSDRASVYRQEGLPERAALAVEFSLGRRTVLAPDGRVGAARFAAGAGRHGAGAQDSGD